MKKLGSLIWQGLFLFNFLLTLVVFYPFFAYFFRDKRHFPHALKLQRIWAQWLTWSMGLKVEVVGRENIPPGKGHIFTPNHTNFLDIILAYGWMPGYFHFMAKGSLARLPLFGILFKNTHIPFDRHDPLQSSRAFVRAYQDLKAGVHLVLFPEGTQNPKAGTLLPFKEGAFRLAEKANRPVIPVVYCNNLERLPHQKDLFQWGSQGGPGKVKVVILPPVYPEDTHGDTQALAKKVHDQMHQVLIAEGCTPQMTY
jgi:1-acyl-sn-glycerol-3-phosphate acyltransferase